MTPNDWTTHQVSDDGIDPHPLFVAVLQPLELLGPFRVGALVELGQLPLQVGQLVLETRPVL